MPNKITKEIKDINRLRQIIDVLIEQGFGYFVEKIRLKSIGTLRRNKKREKLPGEVRLRLTLEKLGPTFIKLGQILSVRPDLVPKAYIRELGKLQDTVPPFSYKEVEEIIEKELKKPVNDLFKSFSEKPIASASISQVHKAELKNGQIVAVKVLRPNVKEIMDTDIEIMLYLAKLAEKSIPKIRRYRPKKIIQEFKEWTDKELDFRIEAKNAKKFYKNFKGSEKVKIPKVFSSYSTKKILTLEFIDGIELHKIGQLKGKKGYSIKEIIKNGFESMLTQVFIHGFFHADPHPSNVLVLKGNKIAFVDFGIVGHFDKNLKKKCLGLFYGIIDEDMDAIADIFLEMGMIGEETDIDEFKSDIRKLIEPLQKSSLKKVKVSYVLEEVLDTALRHHVKLPKEIVLFGKTIVELEGIGLQYAPDFKLVDNARPFLERLIKKNINLIDMPNDFMKSLLRFKKFIRDFPTETTKALRKIQEGKIKVDIEDTDIKKLSLEIDRSSNRLAYGMVMAALIVAGALTMNVDMYKIIGIPWISFISYVMATIVGIMLFTSIIQEKELEVKK